MVPPINLPLVEALDVIRSPNKVIEEKIDKLTKLVERSQSTSG